MRYLGLVCLYWTLAFIIKFIAYLFKTSFFNAETAKSEISYRTACILGATDFLTIVVPVYLVVDPIFVQIMTGNFIYKKGTLFDELEDINNNKITSEIFFRNSDRLLEEDLAQPIH